MSVEKRAYTMAKMAVGNSEDGLDLIQDAMTAFVTWYVDRSEDDWPALFFRIFTEWNSGLVSAQPGAQPVASMV